MSSFKRIAVVLGIGMGCMVLAVWGATVYLKTPHAAGQLLGRVNALVPGTIHVQNHRLYITKGQVELTGLVIEDTAGVQLAGCDRLFVAVSWSSLFTGDLRLQSVVLAHPWANLRMDKNGRVDLVDALKTEKKDPPKKKSRDLPLNIILDVLELTDGSFQFLNDTAGTNTTIRDIDLTAAGDLSKMSARLKTEIQGIGITGSGRDLHLDRFHIETVLNAGKLDILGAQAVGALVNASLKGTVENIFVEPNLDLSLQVESSLSRVFEALGLKPDLSGKVAIRLEVRGKWNNPDADLTVDAVDGGIADLPIDKVAARLEFRDRVMTVKGLSAQFASGELALNGTVDLRPVFPSGVLGPPENLDAIDYRLAVTGTGLNLAQFPLGNRAWAGSVDASVKLSGSGLSQTARHVTSQWQVKGTGISDASNVSPVDVSLVSTTRLDRMRVEIASLDLNIGDTVLKADGTYDLSTTSVDMTLDLVASDLGKSLSPLGIEERFSGNLQGNLAINGPLNALKAEARLVVKGLAVEKNKVGDVTADARLVDGKLYLDPLVINNRGSVVQLTGSAQMLAPGTVTLLKNPVVDLILTANPFRIEDFRDGLRGTITVKSTIKGPLTGPEGSVLLEGNGIDLGFQTVKSMRLSARLAGEKVFIEDFTVGVAADETINGSGWVSMDRQFELRLTSTPIALHRIDYLRDQAVADAKIFLDLSAGGTLDNPRAKGDLSVKDVRVNQKKLDDFTLNLDLRDGLARVRGSLNFEVDGSYQLKTGDFSAKLGFDQTDLGPYFRIAGQPRHGGVLTGKISASGNAGNPNAIRADADITQVSYRYEDVALIRSGKITGSLRDGIFDLTDVHLDLLTEGRLDVNGRVDTKGKLNIDARGEVPVQVIAPFTKAIAEPKGTVHLSAAISGTAGNPGVNGLVELKNVGFLVSDISQKFHDVNGKIRLAPDAITIEGLKGGIETGRFSIDGKSELVDFKPSHVDVKLMADSVPLTVPDTLTVLLSSNLALKGTIDQSQLTGDIVLLDGEYFKDVEFNLLKGSSEKKRRQPSRPESALHPAVENMALDVTIKHRYPLMVDNNLAELEIAPDLKISGTLGKPVVTGRAGVDNGTLYFRKKVFTVTQGVVEFVNPYRIEPEINIEGETQIRDWTIYLKVEGPPEELVLTLRSEPSETDGDIVSLILFGRTTAELIDREGGSSVSSGQVLAGMLAASMEKNIKESTGVDIFEVDTYGDDATAGDEGVKVTVGKELTERITLKYAAESKVGEMVQWAIAEYKLLENILIRGFQKSGGHFGGDLRFKLEFR